MPVPRHAGQSGFALGFCSIVASLDKIMSLGNLTMDVPKTTMSDSQKASVRQKLAVALVPSLSAGEARSPDRGHGTTRVGCLEFALPRSL